MTIAPRETSVSLVGLGKLGLCLAACFAASGVRVRGIDLAPGVVDAVNAGKSPLPEPGLAEAIAGTAGRTLFASSDATDAVVESDVTYVLVNTPSAPDGSFSNRHVERALAALGRALAQSAKSNHLFVVSSTVMPGSIEGSFIPLLENTSGRRLHHGFDVAYCPDFVALGQVMEDFRNPDMILIGESRPEAGDVVERLHLGMCRNRPPVRRMSLAGAELAKVALNAFVTLKISFANTLANVAEHLPGVDVDAVTGAIGLDKRISPHYLKAGLAFGGTCFPRDTRAFKALGKKVGLAADLMETVEAVNAFQDLRLCQIACDMAKQGKGGRVAVLGVAFKPGTPVIVESPGVKLIEGLLKRGIPVAAYDPMALDNLRDKFAAAGQAGDIVFAASPAECLDGVGTAILTLSDARCREALYELPAGSGIRVLDCWRQLDPARIPAGMVVRRWGHADG